MTTINELGLAAMAYPNGRVAVLLSRYPRVSGEELDELLAFTSQTRTAEIQGLRGIPAIRPQLDRLSQDHPARTGIAKREVFYILGAIALILAVSWLLLESRHHPLPDQPAAFSTLSEAN